MLPLLIDTVIISQYLGPNLRSDFSLCFKVTNVYDQLVFSKCDLE